MHNVYERNDKKLVCFIDLRSGDVYFPAIEKFLVGRDGSCELSIRNDSSVSRFHASVVVIGLTAAVRDLDSTNGTFLNDVRVEEPFMLTVGDEVQFGLSKYIFALKEEGEKLLQSKVHGVSRSIDFAFAR